MLYRKRPILYNNVGGFLPILDTLSTSIRANVAYIWGHQAVGGIDPEASEYEVNTGPLVMARSVQFIRIATGNNTLFNDFFDSYVTAEAQSWMHMLTPDLLDTTDWAIMNGARNGGTEDGVMRFQRRGWC